MAIMGDHSFEAPYPLVANEIAPMPRVPANLLSEADLRAFYDPTGRHNGATTEEFIDWVAASRRAEAVAGVGRVTAHEAVLAEATHAFMPNTSARMGVPLPIPERRQEEIADKVRQHAGRIALAVLDTTEDIAAEWEARSKVMPKHGLQRLPSQLLLSGKILAAVAHQHMTRRSGRAYYMHPDEVSSIISVAWRKQKYPEDPLLDVVRFLAYAHDAFEDTIDPYGRYLAKPLIVSPLVAQQLLRAQGRGEANDAARTLLYMTRTRDIEGNRMEYLDYIRRGAGQESETLRLAKKLFMLTKSPDIQHNRSIEPDKIEVGDEKTWEKYRKRQQYEDAAMILQRAADPEDFAYVVHTVFSVTRFEVQHEAAQKYPLNLGHIVGLMHQHLHERTGDDPEIGTPE